MNSSGYQEALNNQGHSTCKRCKRGVVIAYPLHGLMGGYVASCSKCAHPMSNTMPTHAASPERAIRKWNGEEH